MDYLALTTPRPLTADLAAIAQECRRRADIEAIENLVALYSIARDDNDLDRLIPFFASDGAFVVGQTRQAGHADLRAFYAGNMAKYRTSLHVTHTHVIDLEAGAEAATGLVTGHAELAMAEGLIVAAYRYDDRYVREDGRWCFAERVLRFMYAMSPTELADGFHDDRRMRWPGVEATAAEIPESVPSYRRYRDHIDGGSR